MRPRALGQHYLVDPSAVSRIVSMAEIRRGERVLEIGTGKGALSSELAKVADRLEGYEIDESNLETTRSAVRGRKAKLHLGDAFRARPSFDVLVASLPYSRSSSFVEWISQRSYDRAVVVLQRDFAEKIRASPGQRDYRAVSVIAQASAEVREVGQVLRSSFSPEPRVNSVIVALRHKQTLTGHQLEGIKLLFSLRRRQVGAAMTGLGSSAPPELGGRRVYTLEPSQVLGLVAGMRF